MWRTHTARELPHGITIRGGEVAVRLLKVGEELTRTVMSVHQIEPERDGENREEDGTATRGHGDLRYSWGVRAGIIRMTMTPVAW